MMSEFLPAFVAAFVTLFIVIDPIMVTPIFASLTKDDTAGRRLRIAFSAALYSAFILALFGFAGNTMLHHLGVSMAAFRAAMGIILFIMGFRMFFDPDSETQAKTPGPKASARDNIAFFPLAIPMLAGPWRACDGDVVDGAGNSACATRSGGGGGCHRTCDRRSNDEFCRSHW